MDQILQGITVMILSFRQAGLGKQYRPRSDWGAVWSGSALFAIASASFGQNTL